MLAGADPPDAAAEPAPGRAALLLDLMRREQRGRTQAARGDLGPRTSACWWRRWLPATSSSASSAASCAAASFVAEDAELLRAVANQTAVGLKKAELIERLTAENIVNHMFDALAAGSVQTAEAKAADARCDLNRPHVFIHAERAPGGPTGALAGAGRARAGRLRRRYPRAFFDARHDALRELAPLPTRRPEAAERPAPRLRRAGARGGTGDRVQRRRPRRRRARGGACARRPTRRSIGRSLAVDGGAVSYEQLGAYRYLVHLELDEAPARPLRTGGRAR